MLGRLIAADAKMILRNKQALFWALAFPLMFTAIFGLFDFESVDEAHLAVVAEDPATGAPVRLGFEALERAKLINLDRTYTAEATAREALRTGDLDFVVTVRKDGEVEIGYVETAGDRNRIFMPIFRQVINEINLRVARVEPRYNVRATGLAGYDVSYYDFVLPGLVGMAVMTYGIIGLGSTVAQYRGQRILRRILATPLRPRTFLSALVIAHLVLAVVQSTIVMLAGVFIFGGVVRGNLAYIYLLVILGNLTFLNLGFVVASRAQTAEAASGLGNAMSMPMMFFAGVFFPTSGLPWILPTLTSLLPLNPMIDALRKVAIEAAPIGELWGEIAQLAAWAVVTFVIASRMFRFERA